MIGGAANSVVLMVVDPMTFNLGEGLGKVGMIAITSAIFSAAFYLKASPLPGSKK